MDAQEGEFEKQPFLTEKTHKIPFLNGSNASDVTFGLKISLLVTYGYILCHLSWFLRHL